MYGINPENNVETGEKANVTTKEPVVKFDINLKEEILSQIHEEGMVIVHCTFNAESDTGIRIWVSTFLIDNVSGVRSRMHHAENIPIAPVWTAVPEGKSCRFTLIFAPLPKACESFDLFEEIPQAGGFHVKGIRRNESDIYNVIIL